MPNPKAGDVVSSSGTGLVSDVINLATLGIPRSGASHVGVVVPFGRDLLIVESTSLLAKSDVCELTGKATKGVRASTIEEFRSREGRAWLHPLSRSLYPHEVRRLVYLSEELMGQGYDYFGAGRSAGVVFSAIQSLVRGEDLSLIFCSELLIHLFEQIGLYPTGNASRFSPNKALRRLSWAGLLNSRQPL